MDEDYYNEAYAGVNASSNYSGNIAWGTMINKTPLQYILDVSNTSSGVGHRSSMLDPCADSTSFGYCNSYSAMSMYITDEDLGNDDVWYSWPTPGYFPINDIDTSMLWSIQLNDGYGFYINGSGLSLTLTAGDGTSYEIELDNLDYDSDYNTFCFEIPSGLLEYLTDGGDSFVEGKTVTIQLNGIIDEDYNIINIKYTTEFINVEAYLKGDVNGDGDVTLVDYILILKHVRKAKLLSGDALARADVNEDGNVTLLDYILVLKHVTKVKLLF